MKDARSQARRLKIRSAVSAELARYDRATERRADAEYALEQFEEAGQGDALPEEFGARRKAILEAIETAKREEERARRIWQRAVERAEREIKR
jgi:hypothetical protein